jgi:hypothetical protein
MVLRRLAGIFGDFWTWLRGVGCAGGDDLPAVCFPATPWIFGEWRGSRPRGCFASPRRCAFLAERGCNSKLNPVRTVR